MTSRILLVEDNAAMAEAIRYNLVLEGYEVIVAPDGPQAVASVRVHEPDLILLDLMLPGLDGYQVLQEIRREGHHMPVVILSAKGEESDKVRGFRLDADQYVTKPFGILELLERIASLLRRHRTDAEAGTLLAFGDVQVDLDARIVTRAGTACTITPKAFDLLLALWKRRGKVATRLELMRDVWGYDASVVSRTVDSHIAELRRKLEPDPNRPRFIVTVWKIGYRLHLDEPPGQPRRG